MCERPVLLVTLDWSRLRDGRRSLGSASIVAALEEHDVQVEWVERAVNSNDFDLDETIAAVEAAVHRLGHDVLVGVGCYVWNDPQVAHLLPVLRRLGVTVVLGGPQISFTAAGDLAHRYPGVRYFVRGYGEAAMVSLAMGTARHGAEGVFDATQDDHGKRFDGDLTSLPSPYLEGVLEPGRQVRWETQRGCPFRCSFCQHRDPNAKHQRRPYGFDRIAAELELFASAGTQRISVLDPIFHTKQQEAIDILATARDLGLRAKLSLQCRFEMIRPEFLDALEGLDVTLEFGLQTIHEAESRAVLRRNKLNRIEEGLRAVRERAIDFEVSLIYGLPHQTLESFRASVAWCIENEVPRTRAWPLMLLRGTPLYEERDRWGFIESTGPIPEVVESHTFDRADHDAMRDLADWLPTQDRPPTPTRCSTPLVAK